MAAMGNFIFGIIIGALFAFVLTMVCYEDKIKELHGRLITEGLGRYDTRITGSYRQFKWNDEPPDPDTDKNRLEGRSP